MEKAMSRQIWITLICCILVLGLSSTPAFAQYSSSGTGASGTTVSTGAPGSGGTVADSISISPLVEPQEPLHRFVIVPFQWDWEYWNVYCTDECGMEVPMGPDARTYVLSYYHASFGLNIGLGHPISPLFPGMTQWICVVVGGNF